MIYPRRTMSLHIHQLTMFVICLLLIQLSTVSAYFQSLNEIRPLDDLSKRDPYMGIKMKCKTHPRTCPGGFVLRKRRPMETLLNKEYAELGREMFERPDDTMAERQDLKQSFDVQRNDRRYRLLDLLHALFVDNSVQARHE
uniref:Uncharacterized protein n=1 Tax=Arion vulgaris TaxID=1028688 RepID=A0A0B6Y8N3_9EUPU